LSIFRYAAIKKVGIEPGSRPVLIFAIAEMGETTTEIEIHRKTAGERSVSSEDEEARGEEVDDEERRRRL
jgi:hypothetical protein